MARWRTQALLTTAVIAAGMLAASGAPAAAPSPGTTVLVTVGGQGIGGTTVRTPAVSGDGRHVAFATRFGLAPGDGPDWDVYVRSPHGTVLVSDSTEDNRNPSLSADGRYVAFDAAAQTGRRVLVCDRDTDGDRVFDEPADRGCLEVGRPGHDEREPDLSADGTTLVWNEDSLDGTEPSRTVAARLRADGRGRLTAPESYVDLLPVVPDVAEVQGGLDPPKVSADGRHVVFTALLCHYGCTTSLRRSGVPDREVAAFVADLDPLLMTRLPVGGDPGDPVVSGDGGLVALTTVDPATEDRRVVLVRPGQAGSTVVARGSDPALSSDGHYLAYTSSDEEPAQVYARDLARPATVAPELVSRSATCGTCAGDGGSHSPALSADGGVVAFVSGAANLVAGDTNDAPDVFARTFQPTVAAAATDFDTVVPGASAVRAVIVRHVGFGPVRVGQPAVRGSTDFTLYPTDSCTGAVLHAGGECVVSVRFQPTGEGRETAVLVLSAGGQEVAVPLAGTAGAAAGYDVRIIPDELAFPGERLALSLSEPRAVTVTNSGRRPLVVRAVTGLAGPRLYPRDYVVAATDCPGRLLDPGQSCQVTVLNLPHGAGDRAGALLVETSAFSRVVPLRARGVTPVAVANPGVVVGGRVTEIAGTGFPPDQAVVVTLPGNGSPLTAFTDRVGAFAAAMPILANGLVSTVTATVTVPDTDLAVPVGLLVVPGTYQPPTFVGRR